MLEASPVQDVEDLPARLHSAAAPGVLSDGGHRAQDGGTILPLQGAAAHHHHRALGSRQDLEEEGREGRW